MSVRLGAPYEDRYENDGTTIIFERHEFHEEDSEPKKAELSVFVYDIPNFGACGIFPPFHIINQFFEFGSCGGSMSPGASWKPFSISEEEYLILLEKIRDLDPKTISDKARYTFF